MALRTKDRRFGSWTKALREAGLKPQTHQLKLGDHSFIRKNWRNMTDKQITQELKVTETVIKYYRMNFNLWKNRKGVAKTTFGKRAVRLYGEKCEVCGIKICEWHHIKPKSRNEEDWCILCPLCHSVITRKLIEINSRNELNTKLKLFMKLIYKNLNI